MEKEHENKYEHATDGTQIIKWDPYLEPYANILRARYSYVQYLLGKMDQTEGGLVNFAHSYKRYGLHHGVGPDNKTPGVWYREWAPGGFFSSFLHLFIFFYFFFFFFLLFPFPSYYLSFAKKNSPSLQHTHR